MPAPPPGSHPIRLVLAERVPLLHDGLVCLLEQHPEVALVGEAAGAMEAGRLAERLGPDVLLADARLLDGGVPAGGGVRVVALLDERHAEPTRRRVLALLDAGVAGFVSVRDSAATVLEAVCAAASGGEVFLSPRVAARLDSRAGREDGAAEALTPRERDVLARAALGHTAPRIAADLDLAPGTVRNHLSALYAKLGVRTRGAAVAWAWRHGFAGHADALPEAAEAEKKMPDP